MLAFSSRPKIVRIPDSQYFDRICGNNVHLMGLYIFFRAVAINGIMKDGVKFLCFLPTSSGSGFPKMRSEIAPTLAVAPLTLVLISV